MNNFDYFIRKNNDIFDSIKTEDHLVIITKYEDDFNKMQCYDRNLKLIWETPPRYQGFSFTGLHIINGLYFVNDFNCMRYQFDIETGEFLSQEFVK